MEFQTTDYGAPKKYPNRKFFKVGQMGLYKINERPAFGYILTMDGVPIYRGSSLIKPRRTDRFETDLEFSLYIKGRGHLWDLKRGEHKNRDLQAFYDKRPNGIFKIVLLEVHQTRTEALEAEKLYVRSTPGLMNVVGRPGSKRKCGKLTFKTTPVLAKRMRLLYRRGRTQVEIAEMMGCSQPTVHRVLSSQ